MLKIKIFIIAAVFLSAGIVFNSSRQFSSYAQNDEVASEFAKYKIWSKITKEPFRVFSYGSAVGV